MVWVGLQKIPRPNLVDKNGKESKVTKLNDGPVLEVNKAPIDKTYYKVDDKMYIQAYARILIRNKNPKKNS